ncbi:UDP-galactopyranose mutase [Bacillus sp. AK128]
MIDYIIVGSGLAGAVFAERIANVLNKNVIIIEKRNHIAGNTYDSYDNEGVLIHNYGPHLFHTRSKEVWNYLSQFTEWHEYHHRVMGSVDGKFIPIPFNIHSLYEVFPESVARPIEEKLIRTFGFNVKVPILKLKETEDSELQLLADYIYEKVFLHYTKKQWGVTPEELDPTVTGRVPIYISKDTRYFQDAYQGVPKHGYTRMVEKLLDSPNIKILLNTDYKDVLQVDLEKGTTKLFDSPFHGKIIFTGKIDEFFQYEYGELPYRSLKFHFDNVEKEYFQSVGTVNYPNEYDYTRITEFKHITGQVHPSSTIVREYPQDYDRKVKGKDIPYYPVPKKENLERYNEYKKRAKGLENVIFIGRLAEYKYYDMDAVVARSLKAFREEFRM